MFLNGKMWFDKEFLGHGLQLQENNVKMPALVEPATRAAEPWSAILTDYNC